MTSTNCTITFTQKMHTDSAVLFAGVCDPCGVPVWAGSPEDAQTRFEHHRDIPEPPAEVLARPVTVADVDTYPAWFLNGRGFPVAAAAKCQHGYTLVAFCPECA
ncbi:hypothetical protein ACFWU5_16745 [Nocardia sp. NPDC058640]|uniref:hypothetical protein n=1 Tax=Nocardia sp. NPDC058640 TaxID=3346571 RepID=UPI0036687BA5